MNVELGEHIAHVRTCGVVGDTHGLSNLAVTAPCHKVAQRLSLACRKTALCGVVIEFAAEVALRARRTTLEAFAEKLFERCGPFGI